MVSWLIILAIAIAAALLGSAVVLQFLPYRAWRTVNGLFASITVGVVLGGVIGLILSQLGLYSNVLYCASFGVSVVLLLVLAFARSDKVNRAFLTESQENAPSLNYGSVGEGISNIVLLLWLAVAGWLFFRPHEYVQGGADAGVYVSLGAEIAHNGGFRLEDDLLAQLDPALQSIMLRPLPANPVASSYLFPGFYVNDPAAGSVTPQFYPLHPVWQAIAFSMASLTVEGVRAELLIGGLWMTLASVAIFLTARELGGWPAAVLVIAALSLTALQVWFARYPTTEPLTQLLLWSGLWAMMEWQGGKKPASLWAFVAGAALGAVFLVRIDILVLLPTFACFTAWLWLRGWERVNLWFVAPLLALLMYSLLHGALFSAPYFTEHIGFGLSLLWSSWWLIVAGIAAAAAALWLLKKHGSRLSELQQYRSPLALLVISGFLIYALYGWFIRPVSVQSTLRPDIYSESMLLITNHENWRRLGWYLSDAGIWLGVAGICLLIWRVDRRSAVLVAVGITFSVIYLWNIRANPHQVYAMRRYVPVVAPFFLLAGAYFISSIPEWIDRKGIQNVGRTLLGPAAAAAVAALWLLLLGWSSRGFVSQVDQKGVLVQLAALNSELPANSVLLFNDPTPVGTGDFWGTPLKYVFGHDAFKIRDLAAADDELLLETLEFWRDSARSVVWIGDPAWLDENRIPYHETEFTISGRVMEGTYDRKPQAIVAVEWALPTYFVGNP